MEASKPSRSFCDLPGEIRNRIYRLALPHNSRLNVWDLHPDEYTRKKCGGLCFRRTSYLQYYLKSSSYSILRDHPLTETTYCVDREFLLKKLAIGLLALNQQIRNEALSIFYTENSFVFKSVSAIVPS